MLRGLVGLSVVWSMTTSIATIDVCSRHWYGNLTRHPLGLIPVITVATSSALHLDPPCTAFAYRTRGWVVFERMDFTDRRPSCSYGEYQISIAGAASLYPVRTRGSSIRRDPVPSAAKVGLVQDMLEMRSFGGKVGYAGKSACGPRVADHHSVPSGAAQSSVGIIL